MSSSCSSSSSRWSGVFQKQLGRHRAVDDERRVLAQVEVLEAFEAAKAARERAELVVCKAGRRERREVAKAGGQRLELVGAAIQSLQRHHRAHGLGQARERIVREIERLELAERAQGIGQAVSEFFAADSDWRSLRVQSSAGSVESLLLSMASVFSLLRPPSF